MGPLSLAMFTLSQKAHPVLGWTVYYCETPRHKKKYLEAKWLGVIWNGETRNVYRFFPTCNECRLEMIGHPEALERIWNRE